MQNFYGIQFTQALLAGFYIGWRQDLGIASSVRPSMAFGILEDHKLDSVPGTDLLSAKVNQVTTDGARDLKRGTGKHSHIVLIPQPSDDPLDTLNWPSWKKEACFWTLVFASTLSSALYILPSAGHGLLAKEFDVSVDEIASSFTASFLGLGLSALVQNALALKYGRRLAFLLSSLLMSVSCVWTALSPILGSIRASSIFLGVGMVAPEALVPTTIEHMFFVHERGSRTLVWNFGVRASVTLGPFIYGYVIQNLTWQLGFWFAGLACGVYFVAVFFVVPETTYHRQRSFTLSQDRGTGDKDNVKMASTTEMEVQDVEMRLVDLNAHQPKQPSFLSQLKIYNGTFSNESLWKIFVRPFPFLLSPVVHCRGRYMDFCDASQTWFMFVSYSLPGLWLAITNICSATIFTITDHFNPAQIGLTHLAGLVGTVIGALVTGPVNDRTIVQISQRNHGIYEPEYRLVFMLAMLFGVFGYAGWAVGVDHHMRWIGAVACIASVNVGLAVSGGAAMAYLLDTHGANAVHAVSLVNSGRDLAVYGATFFANGFVAARGIKTALVILCACQAVSSLAAVVMYVYGKRVRSFVARHPRFFHGDLLACDSSQSPAPAQETDSKH